jgi:hypothetical protein
MKYNGKSYDFVYFHSECFGKEQHNCPPGATRYRFVMNLNVYRKRMAIITSAYFSEAEERAKEAGKRAHVVMIAVGGGLWSIYPKQNDILIEEVEKLIKSGHYEHFDCVDLRWFRNDDEVITRTVQKASGGHLTIRFGKESPSATTLYNPNGTKFLIDKDSLLVMNYAWDSNSFPGNEYWCGKFHDSSDSSSASCSLITELHNPYINEALIQGGRGDANIRYYENGIKLGSPQLASSIHEEIGSRSGDDLSSHHHPSGTIVRFKGEYPGEAYRIVKYNLFNRFGKNAALGEFEFNSEKFASQVRNRFFQLQKDQIDKHDAFWGHLQRLLFGWLLYMRQTHYDRYGNEERFREMLNSIKPLVPILRRRKEIIPDFEFNFNSNFMVINDNLDSFKMLMDYELVENANGIFPLLASAIRDFYINWKGKTGSGDDPCDRLKNDYFEGDYNRNLLLKFAILMYEPREEMKKCFHQEIHFKDFSIFKTISFMSTINDDYLENLGKMGPKNLASLHSRYFNGEMIRFYLQNNRRFKISNYYEFIQFLRKLYISGLMEKRYFINGIDFIDKYKKSHGWDQQMFTTYIDKCKREGKFLGECNKASKEIPST